MTDDTIIPRRLHQTWKTAQVPPAWRAFQATWRRLHPTWEYRLWTDIDNRAFIAQHYAWFLPVYDAYPKGIHRADAIRYFLLHHYGGVYADLDCECLKPLDDLLGGRALVLGLEPRIHAAVPWVRAHGLDNIVGNAWLASRLGHPFWEHVFERLVVRRHAESVLNATGPFLLTEALATYPDKDSLTVLPADLLYPLSLWDAYDDSQPLDDLHARVAPTAYAIHHWHGSWWREDMFKLIASRRSKTPPPT